MKEWKEMAYSIVTAFQKRNQRKLRKLNDQILKEVSIEFSKSHYELAVISYILSKIVSKPRFLVKENDGKMVDIEKAMKKIAECVDSCPPEEMQKRIDELYGTVKELERGDARFLIDLVSKGKLKVAATVYAQGISLGVASELTGMEKQEILDYAGKTMMFDRVKEEKTIHDRMKIARKLIKK